VMAKMQEKHVDIGVSREMIDHLQTCGCHLRSQLNKQGQKIECGTWMILVKSSCFIPVANKFRFPEERLSHSLIYVERL
jgi:hypothetical protein